MKKKLEQTRKEQIGRGINEKIIQRGKEINRQRNGVKVKPKVYA